MSTTTTTNALTKPLGTPDNPMGNNSNGPSSLSSGNKRNELENLIRELQTKLGSNWDKYHETLSLFLIGKLSRKELVQTVIPLLKDGLIKYHNKLLLLNFANSFKNVPTDFQNEFASFWNKKSKNKTVKSSQYEKFKQNIMGLPLKERRRIRSITRDSGKKNKINAGITLTRHGLLPKISSIQDKEQQQLQVNNLVSWQQDVVNGINTPLATDTYELPDADDLTKRVLMIMRESGLTGGVNPQVLDLIYLGLEQYLKNIVESTVDVARYREKKYNNDDFLSTAIQTVTETLGESKSASANGAASGDSTGDSTVHDNADSDDDELSGRDPKRRKVTLNIDDMFNSLEMFPYMAEQNGPKYRLNNVMLKNDDDNDIYVSNANPIDYELPPKLNILEPVTKINGTVKSVVDSKADASGQLDSNTDSKIKLDPDSKLAAPQDLKHNKSQDSLDDSKKEGTEASKDGQKASEPSKPESQTQPPSQSHIGTTDELKWLVHDLYTQM